MKCFYAIFCVLLCQGWGSSVLDHQLTPDNMRYQTFEKALELLSQKRAPVMVETGIARAGRSNCEGDGCSTIIFADWVREHGGGQLFSVDIDPVAVARAQEGLEGLNAYVEIACQDSIAFLREFKESIDFLYLDSFDFDLNNPRPSKLHHLKEIIAAYPH